MSTHFPMEHFGKRFRAIEAGCNGFVKGALCLAYVACLYLVFKRLCTKIIKGAHATQI